MVKRKTKYLPVEYQEVLSDGRYGRCFYSKDRRFYLWHEKSRRSFFVDGESVPTVRSIVYVDRVCRLSDLFPELPF